MPGMNARLQACAQALLGSLALRTDAPPSLSAGASWAPAPHALPRALLTRSRRQGLRTPVLDRSEPSRLHHATSLYLFSRKITLPSGSRYQKAGLESLSMKERFLRAERSLRVLEGREGEITDPGACGRLWPWAALEACRGGRVIPTSSTSDLSPLAAKFTQLSLGMQWRRPLLQSTKHRAGRCFPTRRGKTPEPLQPVLSRSRRRWVLPCEISTILWQWTLCWHSDLPICTPEDR